MFQINDSRYIYNILLQLISSMIRSKHSFLSLLVLISIPILSFSQNNHKTVSSWDNTVNLSIRVCLTNGKMGYYVDVSHTLSKKYLLKKNNNYSSQLIFNTMLNIYTNTIGTEVYNENVNYKFSERFVGNMVFSPILALGCGRDIKSGVRYATFNGDAICGLRNVYNSSLHFGLNFIKNSKNRSQTVGTFGAKIDNFFFDYFNDGGPGIRHLGLSDLYDRYWTGGGRLGIQLKARHGYFKQLFQVTYLAYTGFSEEAFELSNALLLLNNYTNDFSQYLLNNGNFKISYSPQGKSFFEVGVQGEGGLFIQNEIHKFRREVLHHGLVKNKLYIGARYVNKI